MNLKLGNTEDTYTVAGILALVVILALVLFNTFFPKPNIQTATRTATQGLQTLISTYSKSVKRKEDETTLVEGFTWKISPDKVGPDVLTSVTALAQKSNVTLSNFRPGKVTDLPGISVVQFDSNVSGSYASTSNFIRELEKPENLLAIQSIQITNTDGITDDVNISVSLVAAVDTRNSAKAVTKKT